MLMDFFKSLNWVDILLVAVCARAIFIGIKTGFIVEFFKSTGLLVAIFISFHYYTLIAGVVAPRVTLFEPMLIQVFVFLTLWLLVTLVFKIVRDGLMMLFSIQANPQLDQWGGACIAILRGLVVCSMTLFALLLTQHASVVKVAQKSFSRHVVSNLSMGIYALIEQGIVAKFFPEEAINEEAIAVVRVLDKKSK